MKKSTNATIPLYIAVEFLSTETYESLWITLPVAKEYFNFWRDGIRINGYDTTVPGLSAYKLTDVPFAVVNHLAARLNMLNGEQTLKLTAIMSNYSTQFKTPEQIIDYTYNPDRYTLIPGISTHWEVGQYRISELDFSGLPSALIECFDETRFGHKIARQEDGWFTPLGYISTKDKWDKPARKRRVPASWDIKDKNGEDITGKWQDDDDLLLDDDDLLLDGDDD